MKKVAEISLNRGIKPTYFKSDELFPNALNVRNGLLRITKEEFAKQSKWTFSSFLKLAPIQNHLIDYRKYLSAKQYNYVKALEKTCYQLILTEHLPILKQFYETKKQENSLLGRLYSQLSLEEVICRLIQKKYQAIYLDGRLVRYRSGDEEAIESLRSLPGREKILAVGSPNDKRGLYKQYLTIEETAVSHLIFANGYYLAVNRGIRQFEGFLSNYTTQRKVIKELTAAHVGPILITYIVGPELRNGLSLHYDALLCLEYANEAPGHPHYDRRNVALNEKGFSSIATTLYGNEYPLGPKPKGNCEIIEFKSNHRETAYFYVNAYKTRLRHAMKQVIIAHEFLMPDAGTMRLKGFGLGVFGITSLETVLESVFLQVLEEVLHITRPNKIKKIELLNFPSVMNRYSRESGDIDYYMEHSGGITIPENSVKKYGEVELVHVLAPSLEKTEDIYLSTQICGDSMALPGNEATIGYPPSSSDEAGMYYALGGIQSMSEQTTLSPPELSAKILVTDGVIAHHLNGNKAEIDFSSIEYGHFTEKTVLKTRPLPREQAIQAMDHANMTYGTVASIQEENGYWRTIISVSPDFDRQNLFGTKDS